MVQQGYAIAEPINAAAQGAAPQVFLLAEQGWNTYSTTVETRAELVRTKPEVLGGEPLLSYAISGNEGQRVGEIAAMASRA